MLGAIVICTMQSAVDGDTVKCDVVNRRLLGEGNPLRPSSETAAERSLRLRTIHSNSRNRPAKSSTQRTG